jgi:tetratricopeptide (TPR) repeat protein
LTTGQTIHRLLEQPSQLDNVQVDELLQTHKQWPYFAVPQLLLQYHTNGNTRNLALEELLGYNPVIFHYWTEPMDWGVNRIETESAAPKFKNWMAFEESMLEHEKEHKKQDYFSSQGINVSNDIPAFAAENNNEDTQVDKSLMVVMSFAEWLQFLQRKTKKEQEEEEDKRALKALWQKQKMAEAIEEENDEIPATVFEMAVNSISREDGIVSESMAVVYEKQGKIAEAINIYKKLSLNNPEKSTYFAEKIENLQKEI